MYRMCSDVHVGEYTWEYIEEGPKQETSKQASKKRAEHVGPNISADERLISATLSPKRKSARDWHRHCIVM